MEKKEKRKTPTEKKKKHVKQNWKTTASLQVGNRRRVSLIRDTYITLCTQHEDRICHMPERGVVGEYEA